jgi:tetratricopeptide (TPR) repeat protein
MRAGNDSTGATKLATAEVLLKDLPAGDTEFNGAAMQIAAAKGLRAVLLRDAGRTTDAAKMLDEAISITEKIVSAHPQSSEPLYRLAVFTWQRAGLAGDAGDTDDELQLGMGAANLMQQLLGKGAGKRDTELRRSLAYLYGDLGHTASSKGKKKEASQHFKSASEMWQSLITKIGKNEEFTEGLQWSQQRYREVGGR